MFLAVVAAALGAAAGPPKISDAVVKAWADRKAMKSEWAGLPLFDVPPDFDPAGLPTPEGSFALRLTPGQFAAAAFKPVRGMKTLELLQLKKEGKIDAAVVAALRELPGLRDLQVWEYVDSDPQALKDLGALDDLQSLTASTGVNDDTVRAWGKAKKLTALNLTGSRAVTGKGIGDLRGLKTLILNQARVTDDGVLAFAALKDLERLDLSFAYAVTDKGAAGLTGLTNLKELNLAHTNLTDAGLKSLPPKLTTLNLSEVRTISDAGLKTLQAYTELKRLKVSGTNVSTGGIAAFKKAVPGCEVVND